MEFRFLLTTRFTSKAQPSQPKLHQDVCVASPAFYDTSSLSLLFISSRLFYSKLKDMKR